MRARVAGTGKPEIAIMLSSPAVLSTTVFPPALAPEMIITGLAEVRVKELATMALVSELITVPAGSDEPLLTCGLPTQSRSFAASVSARIGYVAWPMLSGLIRVVCVINVEIQANRARRTARSTDRYW